MNPADEVTNFPSVELHVTAPAGLRRGPEPITCGIPWPRGTLRDTGNLALRDAAGQPVPLQARPLNHWPDGSVRWALLDWQAEVTGDVVFHLTHAPGGGVASGSPKRERGGEASLAGASGFLAAGTDGVKITPRAGSVTIDTGAASFELAIGEAFPFRAVTAGGAPALDLVRTCFRAQDEQGRWYRPRIDQLTVEEAGPLRVSVRLAGALAGEGQPLTDFLARLTFFAGSAAVRFELTLRNPRKADHPGGTWDLGNGGSVYLRDAALTVALPAGEGEVRARCSAETGKPFEAAGLPLELYQDSSGGENWQSSNHLNRHRQIPNTFRGYRFRAGSAERTGQRATPAVVIDRAGRAAGLAVPRFWQNFPRAVEADADGTLVLRLFPRQFSDVHELQGGEQKTHTFTLVVGAAATAEEVLAWCREPAHATARPEWYCSTGAIPYLTPRTADPHPAYLRLVDAAIEGPDTFDHKREVIDEYSWRHFGDIYGDHEAVFHQGPTPLVSHYNNQYDGIAGFAYQFLRSGDARWWRHMDELAWHVIDIDIYHTDEDKSAYNHGLFWHTYHYFDADTGTHRSYPRALRRPPDADNPTASSPMKTGRSPRAVYALGGGPANEQNYIAGLVLHHFLTGCSASRDAALELARWVIDLDDGTKTVFRWLAGGDTGLASKSRSFDYHGPGRGSGNSLAALVEAHKLSGDDAFLNKAEQLVRRCIHPADDLAARKLLDVENRWFYTMFLQALGRYLDHKAELGQLDRMYAYARASLLHYARWMAENEYPYLEKPEILEYPTETWAAQDMRKCEVFHDAARHAGALAERFLERADFFFQKCVETLERMPTRTLARPVVLLLSYGWRHAHFRQGAFEPAPPPARADHDFGRPEVFVPQKVRALKRFKALAAAGAVVFAGGVVYLVSLLLR